MASENFQAKLSVQVLRSELVNVMQAIEEIWGLWLGDVVVCKPEYESAPCQWVHLDDANRECIQRLCAVKGVQVLHF